MSGLLPEALVERILEKLGFQQRPELTLEGLATLYDAWGRKVPFDNVRKMIHIRTGNPAPLPGSDPVDYFEAWLAHGTGGTCWAGAGPLHAFLSSLGYPAVRGIGTMMAAPDIPPNHGTVSVIFDGKRYLIDSSILCGEPLLLDPAVETVIPHPAWGLKVAMKEGRHHISWRPISKPQGLECRLETFEATDSEFQELHERTRAWSPFNHELSVRLNRGDEVVGISLGELVTFHADGTVTRMPATPESRRDFLLDTIGLSEEIVDRLPADQPTPPPPGSRTAAAMEQA
ncbi:MAG: arylamine N-acetyltransferase [Luteolibacter sp.]